MMKRDFLSNKLSEDQQIQFKLDILALLVILFITTISWQLLIYVGAETNRIRFFLYAPNAYRLFNWLLIQMDDFILSFYGWAALTFLVVLILSYYLIRPRDFDYLLFLAWIVFLPRIFHALQLLLLVILVKYSETKYSSLILIPLALVKEIAFWQGFGYLFLSNKRSNREIFILAFISSFCYLWVRFIIIGDLSYDPNNVPLFSIPFLIQKFITDPSFIIFHNFTRGIPLLILLCLTIQSKIDFRIVFWNIAPVVLFAVYWETQLWLPIALIILSDRKHFRRDSEPKSDQGYFDE